MQRTLTEHLLALRPLLLPELFKVERWNILTKILCKVIKYLKSKCPRKHQAHDNETLIGFVKLLEICSIRPIREVITCARLACARFKLPLKRQNFLVTFAVGGILGLANLDKSFRLNIRRLIWILVSDNVFASICQSKAATNKPGTPRPSWP